LFGTVYSSILFSPNTGPVQNVSLKSIIPAVGFNRDMPFQYVKPIQDQLGLFKPVRLY